MTLKVAIVTGANKGIGLSIVKGLCEKFSGDVYLTSRDETRGLTAVPELEKLGLKPKYHQLDLLSDASVQTFAQFIREKYGGIDLLVNNAATGRTDIEVPNYEEAKTTIDTNYYGFMRVCNALLPLMKLNSRVINLSSMYGHLSNVKNPEYIKLFSKPEVSAEEVQQFVDHYMNGVKNGTEIFEEISDKWSDYKVTKVATTLLTFLQHRQLQRKGIAVNCVHPGFIKTDLTLNLGLFSTEEASTLYLALEAPQNLSGQYIWCDNSVVDWYDLSREYYLFYDGIIR